MSKNKKLSPMERIAISLDSIDGLMNDIAGSYRRVSICAEKQVAMQERHMELAEEHAEMFRMVKRLAETKRPWWKKLMGMS